MASATGGAAMIYIAAHIAPTDHKRTPVVIMATLCTCIWLFGLAICIAYEDWFEGFRQLVALGACIVAAVIIYKESPTTSDWGEPSHHIDSSIPDTASS